MKLSVDYKMQFQYLKNKLNLKRLVLNAFFILLCILILPQNINALTAEVVNQQINDVNSQIQALDKEILQYQNQISETSEQSNTLANLIKELTLTRSKLLKETQVTEKKIKATNLVIGTLADTITTEQKSIDNSNEVLRKIFKTVSERDNTSFIQRILSKDNILEVNREYNDLLSINEKVNSYVASIKKQKEDLIQSKNIKETEQQNLNSLKKTLTQKKLVVDITKKEKDSLLTQTKNQESNYKKLLADSQKKRDAFEKDLQNYEAQLKFILNPKLLPSEGSGVLSWPLDNIFITQLFGKTISAKRLYVSGS